MKASSVPHSYSPPYASSDPSTSSSSQSTPSASSSATSSPPGSSSSWETASSSQTGASSVTSDETSSTASDVSTLASLGKTQVLKRRFKFRSLLAFAVCQLIIWETVLTLLKPGYQNGGAAGLVWGYIIAWVSSLCVHIAGHQYSNGSHADV